MTNGNKYPTGNLESFSVVNASDEHMFLVYGKNNLHNAGGYHRAVHVFVEIFGGKFVLQKKAKRTENAGKWSSSVSGHVRYNESYEEAAVRETKEELGLNVSSKELHRIAKIPPSLENGGEFVTLFTYLMDPEEEEIKLESDEVEELVTCKLEDIIEDVEKNRAEYSPAFVEAFNIFLVLEKGTEGVRNGKGLIGQRQRN